FENWLDLVLHLIQRFHVRVLLVVDADDVEAVAALYQIDDLPFWQRKGNLFKLGNSLAFADPSQRAILLSTARILGVLLGKIFELRAGLQLLEQIFGSMLRFRDTF